MSHVRSPEAEQAIEDAREQIRRIAAEITRLSRMELSAEEFLAEFLGRVVAALAATGGAVWIRDSAARLTLQHHLNLQATGLEQADKDDLERHGRLLERSLARDAMIVPPHSGGEDGLWANPTGCLLVLAPVKTEAETVGLVEIFQRPDTPPEVQRGYLRFLAQMCDLAGDYFKGRQLRQLTGRQALWTQLEQFARAVHKGLNSRKTAYTIANEGCHLTGADRVSVALRRGRKYVVEAVSGQDVLNRRSNAVRLLGDLARAAATLDEPLWYAGDATNLAPQLEEVLQRYVDETDAKLVGVLPLRPPDDETAKDAPADKPAQEGPPLGALIVERIDDSRLLPGMADRAEVVAVHAGEALANALHHEGLFLHGLWDTIGRARWLVQARTLPKTVLAAAVALLVLLWLCLWPAKFELSAKGTLEPVLRRDVFAGIDGRVEEIRVAHGDRVAGPDPATGSPGTLLVRLSNHELDEALAKVAGERLTTSQQMRSVERSLLEGDLKVVDQNQASAQLTELRQRLANLDAQWAIYLRKQKGLAIRSPASGVVVTWDVDNLLLHRPVARGQRLVQVADPDGPWELEIKVPEDYMGHVVEAQAQRREAGDEEADRLPVAFVLATDPGTHYRGVVREIHGRAEVRGDEGNTVLVRVEIAPDDAQRLAGRLMPGAGVSAKIDCGRCPVGYDLLHEVGAWVQRLWFKWF